MVTVICTLIWILLMVWTFVKAREYNRSTIIWVLIGLVVSPIVSLISLFILGKSYEYRN
mgnify:CR=1 FL=1